VTKRKLRMPFISSAAPKTATDPTFKSFLPETWSDEMKKNYMSGLGPAMLGGAGGAGGGVAAGPPSSRTFPYSPSPLHRYAFGPSAPDPPDSVVRDIRIWAQHLHKISAPPDGDEFPLTAAQEVAARNELNASFPGLFPRTLFGQRLFGLLIVRRGP